jgi:hypothetical protein
MKEIFQIEEDEDVHWLFAYQADADPRDELSKAGARLIENALPEDMESEDAIWVRKFCGEAFTEYDTEDSLRLVQARLIGEGWIFNPAVSDIEK